MTIRGIKTLRRAACVVRSRFVRGSIILLYHRIADTRDDPFSLNVPPARFAEHLQAVRRIGRPIPLNGLVDGLERGSVPSRGIVVTFDDGYADNLREARPLLEQYDVPATVFVTSGLLGGVNECWWDALSRMLLTARTPSAPLRLTIAGKTHVLRAERGHTRLRTVHRLLRAMDDERRAEALRQIGAWAEVELVRVAVHRCLSAAELKELAASPVIDVGAHTSTHPALSDLPAARARRELVDSKDELERILGRPVTSCAYPYGLASDYSDETLSLTREAGYRCACTAIPDVVWRRTDPFQLPRLWVGDWSADTFTRQLSVWLHG